MAPPAKAALALTEALEALTGPDRLWIGQAGECLGGLLSALIEDGVVLPDAKPQAFADILNRLVNEETLRVGGATHPRLRILGAIEARLVRADRLVLAGLEEGIWPQGAPIDPFLSRPMREKLGLPPPERRVGLTAHDFAQAASAPDVILVHCERTRRRAGRRVPLAVATEDPGRRRGDCPCPAAMTPWTGPAPSTLRAPTPPIPARPRPRRSRIVRAKWPSPGSRP